MENLGQNIKKYREELNISQLQLAEKLGVKRSTVGSWERNRTEPNMKYMRELCNFFSCTISDLTGVKTKRYEYYSKDLEIYFDSDTPSNMKELFKYSEFLKDMEKGKGEKDNLILTAGEKRLIQELRQYKEVDAKTLEQMFNAILKYKQDNGTLAIKDVPNDHSVYIVTEKNFLDKK